MRFAFHISIVVGAFLSLGALLAANQSRRVAESGGRWDSTAVSFSQAMIDDAMSIPYATSGNDFVGGGGPNYGRQAACILYLALVANQDAMAASSGGDSVLDRALDHVRATATPIGTPRFAGGHTSWFDSQLPLAWCVVRQNAGMWERLTTAEHDHMDLVMEHVLHTAAIFCQPNSARSWQISSVRVDMFGNNAGSLPNQSAPWHSYLTAAYIYWGGVPAMDAILGGYDVESFKGRLQAAGLATILGYYNDERIANLLEGIDQTGSLGSSWSVDPLGVRKTIARFNTSSLIGSVPGEEHPYRRYDPLPTTPANLVYRWGHEFYAGAQPRSNVGPGLGVPCAGTDFGLVDDDGLLRAVMPYEFEGLGMPYEYNARSSTGGPHTRSSWHYGVWGWTHYAYLYATVSLLGYFDLAANGQDRALFRQIRKTTEIVRFVGESKWRSSAGIASQICTWAHGDAYSTFAGNHWAQDLVEELVFSTRLPRPVRQVSGIAPRTPW